MLDELAIDKQDLVDSFLEAYTEGTGLSKWADKHGLKYSDIIHWTKANSAILAKVKACATLRQTYIVEQFLDQLQTIAQMDPLDIYEPKTLNVRNLEDIPEHVRKCITSIKTKRYADDSEMIEVKLSDRLKGIELLGKELQMFVESTKVDVGPTLAEMLGRGITKEAPPKRPDGARFAIQVGEN